MNWEDRTEDEATRLSDADMIRPEDGHFDVFCIGAKWQREQLRTDEAVERVAIYLHDSAGEPWPWGEHDDHCTRNGDCELKAHYRRDARAAITALLGEDT